MLTFKALAVVYLFSYPLLLVGAVMTLTGIQYAWVLLWLGVLGLLSVLLLIMRLIRRDRDDRAMVCNDSVFRMSLNQIRRKMTMYAAWQVATGRAILSLNAGELCVTRSGR